MSINQQIFDAFQNKHVNKHLCYTLLEMFLVTLVHELESRDLSDVLVTPANVIVIVLVSADLYLLICTFVLPGSGGARRFGKLKE